MVRNLIEILSAQYLTLWNKNSTKLVTLTSLSFAGCASWNLPEASLRTTHQQTSKLLQQACLSVGLVADEDEVANAVADAVQNLQEQFLRRPQASVSCAGKWAANRQHAQKETRPRRKNTRTGKLSVRGRTRKGLRAASRVR